MNGNLINFYSENDFSLGDEKKYSSWVRKIIESEARKTGEISYIFCEDEYLLKLNREYLNHDTFTDIISFDNSLGRILNGDIFISTERVLENAKEFGVSFDEELRRVMAHGILHFCGYSDKTTEDKEEMRRKEEEKMNMFHVEQ